MPSIVTVPLDEVAVLVLVPLIVIAVEVVEQDPLSVAGLSTIKSICIASSLNCSNTSSLRPGVAL